VETLGVLDVDGLDVGVQLLLSALLVVTLTRNADTEAVRDALDAGLPDLLVELGVEADVVGALCAVSKPFQQSNSSGSRCMAACHHHHHDRIHVP
jgi:hypothetical protein